MKDWNSVIAKIVEIQNEHNSQKPSEYHTIGDTLSMIEYSFIGKCNATLEDYIQGIAKYYEVARGAGRGKKSGGE